MKRVRALHEQKPLSLLALNHSVYLSTLAEFVLDTSPSMPPTHWAQTVLPLSGNQMPVHDGQTVVLRLNLAKGLPEDDHRGLVFAVQVASSKEHLDDAPVISYSMS